MAPPILVVFITVMLAYIKVSGLESFHSLESQRPILQKSFVEHINKHSNAGWKASMSTRFSNYTVQEFAHLLGVLPTPQKLLESVPVRVYPKGLKLPNNFDARKAWPHCTSTRSILDQGHCGSCWAFAAVEALSDRFCIHFQVNATLSENDLVACCGFLCGAGCNGGFPLSAWRYFHRRGVVTDECDPYFDNDGCNHPGCEPSYPTPRCVRQCTDNQKWSNSKHYSADTYRIKSDPYNIMAEVFTNGPVEVSFSVYEDFAHYETGVYKHVQGRYLGGHAVKLIGWGTTDEGIDYWLIANSWNTAWGEGGYFKIARGVNECGIEREPVAGMPSAKNLIQDPTDQIGKSRQSW